MLGRPLPVDADVLARARRGRPPEARFRFAGACVEGRCRQWTGSTCGVIARVMAALAPADGPGPLPPCGSRGRCRRFAVRDRGACRARPEVVTDGGGAARPPLPEPAAASG